jgi:hypothetical protein
MDDIELFEPDEIPQPPELVKIESLTARVYPDGRRVRLDIKLTPFLERPNLELSIRNANGQEVASLAIIESVDYKFEMTAHLRGPQPVGPHTVRGELFYGEAEKASARMTAETTFEVPQSGA